MDVQMPELDGVAATRAIRAGEAGAANRTVPVVAVTAYAMDVDRESFLAAGMDGYLAKPVELEALRDVLERVRER
jgi:CheY-like chemotaxis protein